MADQIRHTPGNATLIWRDLTSPPGQAGGLSQGVRLMLVHLNPLELLRGHVSMSIVVYSRLPGAVFLAVWLASVAVAWKLADRKLLLLDAVIAVCLVLGTYSLGKIYGNLFWYLMLWAWALCGLMIATVLGTALAWWRTRADAHAWATTVRGGLALGSVVALLLGVALTVDATQAEIPDRTASIQMGHVIPPTIAAVRDGEVPGDRGTGRYLVTWEDPVNIGGPAYTMLDELDRHGLPAGIEPRFRGIVTDAELVVPGTERGVVHVSIGKRDIEKWRALPGVREVAYYDGRTPQQIARFAQLRADAMRRIAAVGGDPSVVDSSIVRASLDGNVPLPARTELTEMGRIGEPVAIFLAAPGTGSGS